MADSRPNIIFIITDQQRYDTICELGFDYMDTPHLDRSARRGTGLRLPALCVERHRSACLTSGKIPSVIAGIRHKQ